MTSSDVNIIFEEKPVEITLNEDPVEIEIPAGQNGQSLRPRGAWSSSEGYGYLDLVSYQGSSYVATKTVPTGTLPTDTGFWMLSAEKGLDGASEWGDITGDIANQTDLAQALAGKANVGDSYTKAETDSLLADKADADDVYTKTEVDDALADKANSADVYTKDETDALLQDKAPVILNSASGSIASFTDGSPAPVTALSVGIEPVQAGTGDPSPDNVRPISGWTGANVFLQAENLFDDSQISSASIAESGSITNSSSYYVKTACVKKGLTYYTNSALVAYWTVKPDKNITGKVYDNTRHSLVSVDNFVPPMDGWVALRFSNSSTNPMLSLTPFTEYKAPTGTTLPISWQTEAGTVYGGSLDVTTGLLTVTKVMFTLTSDMVWNSEASSNNKRRYFRTKIGNKWDYVDNDIISSHFMQANITANNTVFGINYLNSSAYSEGIIYVRPQNIADILTPNDFKDWLDTQETANTPLQCVVRYTSPQTVQLTPAQMQTLLGENHIWADTGDTSVEYRADTKRFIEGQIAESETLTRKMIADSATADGKAPKSIATGDLIIVGDELRKATANIGNGSAITASNSTTATLADVIKALQ